jgi:hypothetical protein
MKYRKLRIAWSVAWGFVAVLLLIFWVRSYWRWEGVTFWIGAKQQVIVMYQSGRVAARYSDYSAEALVRPSPLFTTLPAIEGAAGAGFMKATLHNGFQVAVPCWFLVPFAFALGVAPWTKTRKELLALLGGTVMLSAGLGLASYAAMK